MQARIEFNDYAPGIRYAAYITAAVAVFFIKTVLQFIYPGLAVSHIM